MIIKIDVNSYKSSHIFNFIIEDLLLVQESFNNYIFRDLESLKLNDQQFEKKRLELAGENLDGDLRDIYIDRMNNSQLMNFILNGALLYFYSQFEIKLFNICERLPLIIKDCQKIDDFTEIRCKLDRIAKYLKLKADIDIKSSKHWLNISDFNEVRNSITHEEYLPTKKINTFRSIEDRNKGKIKYNKISNSVIIEISYLSEMIDISIEFIEQIILDIWKKHKK